MHGASEQWPFGPFRLTPSQRLLLEEGTPIALGGRAYALLVLVAARAGEVLSNDELIAEVWQGLRFGPPEKQATSTTNTR